MTIINESGLYSLIFSSKLPSARQFARWVTSEVLPSIRKHGGYIMGQESMTDEELIAKALLVADRKIKARDQRILQLKDKVKSDAPKVLFADAVTSSPTCILVRELSKILKQNGIEIGQNRLFARLREDKRGTDYNMPTQKSMEMGLFEIKETPITHSDGRITIGKTPRVTSVGQQYFVNRYLNQICPLPY